MTRATHFRSIALGAVAVLVAGCGALLGGPDLPVPDDGGVQDATSSRDGPDSSGGSDGGPDSPTSDAVGSDDGPDSSLVFDGPPSDVAADSTAQPSADAGADACSPLSTRCSTTTSEETCASTGQWGSPVPCETGVCSAGVCGNSSLSCAPGGEGMTNCGAGGSGTESCCTSLEVEGGTYYRTYTAGSLSSYQAPAAVSGLRLDEYLVTVGRFRQFVSAWSGGTYPHPATGAGKHAYLNGGQGLTNSGAPGTYETGWAAGDATQIDPTTGNLTCNSPYSTWTDPAGSQESLPINCVNWYEAYAFCIWDGGFLPSEAEWEYAAAGGNQQREYPWGSGAPGTTNQRAIYGCDYPGGSGVCAGVANIAPVGFASLGTGAWGQLDLAGEVAEWNLDWQANYQMCTNCAYLTTSFGRIVRGGTYFFAASTLLAASRQYVAPSTRSQGIGFRCARSP